MPPHAVTIIQDPHAGKAQRPPWQPRPSLMQFFELANLFPSCPSRSLSLKCSSCTWIFPQLASSCHSGVSSSVTSSEKPSLSTQPKIAFQSLSIASLFCFLPSSYSSLIILCLVTIISLISCIIRAINYMAQTYRVPARFQELCTQ